MEIHFSQGITDIYVALVLDYLLMDLLKRFRPKYACE